MADPEFSLPDNLIAREKRVFTPGVVDLVTNPPTDERTLAKAVLSISYDALAVKHHHGLGRLRSNTTGLGGFVENAETLSMYPASFGLGSVMAGFYTARFMAEGTKRRSQAEYEIYRADTVDPDTYELDEPRLLARFAGKCVKGEVEVTESLVTEAASGVPLPNVIGGLWARRISDITLVLDFAELEEDAQRKALGWQEFRGWRTPNGGIVEG